MKVLFEISAGLLLPRARVASRPIKPSAVPLRILFSVLGAVVASAFVLFLLPRNDPAPVVSQGQQLQPVLTSSVAPTLAPAHADPEPEAPVSATVAVPTPGPTTAPAAPTAHGSAPSPAPAGVGPPVAKSMPVTPASAAVKPTRAKPRKRASREFQDDMPD